MTVRELKQGTLRRSGRERTAQIIVVASSSFIPSNSLRRGRQMNSCLGRRWMKKECGTSRRSSLQRGMSQRGQCSRHWSGSGVSLFAISGCPCHLMPVLRASPQRGMSQGGQTSRHSYSSVFFCGISGCPCCLMPAHDLLLGCRRVKSRSKQMRRSMWKAGKSRRGRGKGRKRHSSHEATSHSQLLLLLLLLLFSVILVQFPACKWGS